MEKLTPLVLWFIIDFGAHPRRSSRTSLIKRTATFDVFGSISEVGQQLGKMNQILWFRLSRTALDRRFLFVKTGARYNRVNLCTKITNFVCYNRVFVNNRVRYNRVSLYSNIVFVSIIFICHSHPLKQCFQPFSRHGTLVNTNNFLVES